MVRPGRSGRSDIRRSAIDFRMPFVGPPTRHSSPVLPCDDKSGPAVRSEGAPAIFQTVVGPAFSYETLVYVS
jgi:hypothetical protein